LDGKTLRERDTNSCFLVSGKGGTHKVRGGRKKINEKFSLYPGGVEYTGTPSRKRGPKRRRPNSLRTGTSGEVFLRVKGRVDMAREFRGGLIGQRGSPTNGGGKKIERVLREGETGYQKKNT